jgi:hypothetical protein
MRARTKQSSEKAYIIILSQNRKYRGGSRCCAGCAATHTEVVKISGIQIAGSEKTHQTLAD